MELDLETRKRNFNTFKFNGNYDMCRSVIEDMFNSKQIDLPSFAVMNNELPLSERAQVPRKRFTLNISPLSMIGINNLTKRDFLLKRMNIEKGMLISLCGSGGTGKTLFAQQLAVSLANNLSLFGSYDFETGSHRVLHIDQEQALSLTQRRYERIANGLGITSFNVDRTTLEEKFDDPNVNPKEIEESLIEYFKNYSLVIIDSLRQVFLCDENNSQIGHHINLLKRVAEKSNTVVLLIHHKGKSSSASKQTARGSSAIYDVVDMQIDLDAVGNVIEVSCAKNRDGEYWRGMSYSLSDTGNFVFDQNCTEKLLFVMSKADLPVRQQQRQEQILDILTRNSECNLHGLFDDTGKGNRALFNQLIKDMIQQKLIKERTGDKNARLFSLGENGITHIEQEMEGF